MSTPNGTPAPKPMNRPDLVYRALVLMRRSCDEALANYALAHGFTEELAKPMIAIAGAGTLDAIDRGIGIGQGDRLPDPHKAQIAQVRDQCRAQFQEFVRDIFNQAGQLQQSLGLVPAQEPQSK